MPIVEILVAPAPNGRPPFNIEEITRLIKGLLLKVKELGLTGEYQIDVFIPLIATESKTVVAKVLLDKNPVRTRDVQNKVADLVMRALQSVTVTKTFIEVLVLSFDHETSGYSCSKW